MMVYVLPNIYLQSEYPKSYGMPHTTLAITTETEIMSNLTPPDERDANRITTTILAISIGIPRDVKFYVQLPKRRTCHQGETKQI